MLHIHIDALVTAGKAVSELRGKLRELFSAAYGDDLTVQVIYFQLPPDAFDVSDQTKLSMQTTVMHT